jgi:hypothetical protein
MKHAIAATLGLLCMTCAVAQTATQTTLKLDLPSSGNIPDAGASAKADDAPGKYYGDVGGKDDPNTNTTVSGSVSTAVGYAKGYGTGFSNAADLNVNTQLKNGTTLNLNIGVTQSNGFPTHWGHGSGPWLNAGP